MAEGMALLPLVQKYFESDLVSAVRDLESMPEEEVVEVLRALPAGLAAQAVRQLQISYAAAVLRGMEPEFFKNIVASLEPYHAATIFMHLPRESREQLFQYLSEKLKREIQELLAYPENSVGRLMSTRFLAFRESPLPRLRMHRDHEPSPVHGEPPSAIAHASGP